MYVTPCPRARFDIKRRKAYRLLGILFKAGVGNILFRYNSVESLFTMVNVDFRLK
jgi:hypothetical protein